MFHFLFRRKALLALFLCFPLGLNALTDVPNQMSTQVHPAARDEVEYLAIVNQTGGYITQSFHQQFWEIMKAKYDETQRDKIVREIQYSIDILKEFQIKTWESAKESFFLKKVEKVKEYDELKSKLLQLQSQYYTPRFIAENAEKIIEAAANRLALDLGTGKYYITPEFIQENMIGINGSYERLRLLMTPTWQEDYKEFTLPKINISLLSLYAPDEYHEVITNRDEKIDIHLAQLRVNADSVYEIASIDYQKGDKKFTDFTQEEKEIYVQEFLKGQLASQGINDPSLSKGSWRGYEYAKGVAVNDKRNLIIMSLIVNNKAFYIKYITTSTLSSAGSDFNEFTKRIQLLDNS